jgi:ADP-ribosyl-[dinitrogen reductase] hydrolase
LRILDGESKDEMFEQNYHKPFTKKISIIAASGFAGKHESQIKGSGYVVESLEAALWCFYRTESFRDAILMAANLGDDADTTAAITGQIAGAFYGKSGIPKEWLSKLVMANEIERIALRLRK